MSMIIDLLFAYIDGVITLYNIDLFYKQLQISLHTFIFEIFPQFIVFDSETCWTTNNYCFIL